MVAQYQYITSTGTIAIDTSSLKADIEGEWKGVYGQDFDVSAESPQGTMIAAETISRAAVMKNNMDVANLINPNLSYGTWLAAICALLGLEPGKDSFTTGVNVAVTGDPATAIPAGARLSTGAGDTFVVAQAAVIGDDRTGLINVISQTTGVVDLPVGSLTITDGEIGWGSAEVETTTTVVLGSLALTDAQLKSKRSQRLFAMGIGSVGAVQAHALGVNGVNSANVMENLTGAPGVINGVTFSTSNGMWVCVSGSYNDDDLAAAIYAAHMGGQPWEPGNGSQGAPVTVTATDPYSTYGVSIKFLRAVLMSVHVKMSIQLGSSSATVSDIIAALISYGNGDEDNELGLQIGDHISAFEFSGVVTRNFPGVYVKSCMIAIVAAGVTPVDGDYVYEYLTPPWIKGTVATGYMHVVSV